MTATVQITKPLAFNLILHKLRNATKGGAGFRSLFSMEDGMPRFYMNIREGDTLIEDPEGHDFPSLAEARREAIMSARELMSSRVAAGKNPNHSKFEITDEAGRPL